MFIYTAKIILNIMVRRKKLDKEVVEIDKTLEVVERKGRRSIRAILAGENVFSNTQEAMNLYGESRFGELVEGKVHYSLSEALYLVEKKRMHVYAQGKKLSYEKFLQKAKELDKKIQTKYMVFRDLRNKGYIVKTALKFGADFRVYSKGVFPGDDHAKWVLYPVHESQELTWHEFAAKNRVAHSTKKNLLIGIVDDEGDVTYYEIAWVRP